MAGSLTRAVEIGAGLFERVRLVADERGVAVRHLVEEALENQLETSTPDSQLPARGGGDGEQPPVTCIGAFSSGRGDLSKLASEDVFEPEPFR
jgi:hypothetical protein